MTIRIIQLPKVKMARSGGRDLEEFDRWWSKIASEETGVMYPKDFMWYNEKLGCLEWIYAIPQNLENTSDYEVFDFPGGLYAVATAYDEDEDRAEAYNRIYTWVKSSEHFDLATEENDPNYHTRYGMGHVITPQGLPIRNQFDIYVPLNLK